MFGYGIRQDFSEFGDSGGFVLFRCGFSEFGYFGVCFCFLSGRLWDLTLLVFLW